MSGFGGLLEEVRELEALGLEELRAAWRRRIGPPPKLRSPELLRHLLAWRIQADRLGGWEAGVVRALKRGSGVRDPRAGLAQGARIIPPQQDTYRFLPKIFGEFIGIYGNHRRRGRVYFICA